ncbi:glycosyltransferase [bacterium]|nr:glycosyltransferase [bacterium]
MEPLSIIFPLYNSAKLIPNTIEHITTYLKAKQIDYEIILFDNGSSDNTYEIAQSMASQHNTIRAFRIPEKGIGLALKQSILKARFDHLFMCGIDLAFGTKVIDDSYMALVENDAAIVMGSKLHPKSQVKQNFKRRLGTYISSFLRRFILGLKTRDPQGSIYCKKNHILKPLSNTKCENFFFTTELISLCEKQHCKIVEVPVSYTQEAGSGSTVKIFSDAFLYIKDLLKSRFSNK